MTSHLQRIQNYAARVILRLPMSSSITIHLKSLHWRPVKVRSTNKIACLCYHCHSSTAPSNVTDMLYKKPSHTRNTRSSSYTMPLLNKPVHSMATLGDRSSRGGGIATVYKSTLGSNITFKTNFDFTHTSFEVVQASITLQHNTLHF